ncbi:MAG: PKD domain-containing protein, partial [Bacteroidota bacterium]
ITGLLAGNYTVTVTDATNSSCFATLTLTVGPGAASANASFTFSSFCQGAANSAVVTGTPGGTFSFNPVPTNGETINPSTGQITGGIGGNTYTVQYTVGSPCPATTTQNVTVYANPTVSISGSTSFCTGGSTTLDAGGGYTAYSWNSGATTQTISVNTAGTYSVTVTTANGCTGTASIAVTVAANLTPNITGVLSICSGAATTLDAGGGYATYLWSTGATTQTINVSTPGTYSVTVSDGAGGTAVFWTEDFQNSCASGCLANAYSGTNGAWTVTNTGANGADANAWFVSGSECGNAAGACGTSCGATDPSLHVGSTTIGNDPGAAYMAGGLGFWFPETDKRVESPTINCTGQSSITLNFNYMENGQAAIDNATLWYYDGAAWSQLFDLTKTATTCAPQGLWTAYSIALPGSADNNPGVKIGFRWVNNDDNVGTDPSFAVDDIELTSSGGGGSCTGTDSVIVTLNNNPTPNITGSLSFCTGGSTILDAGAGYSAYVWSPSGTTQTISVNTAGNYSVTVTDANGCTGTDQVDVTVAANLSPSITGVLAICSGASTTLDAGGGYSTYNWSTGSTSQTISVSTAGTYTVTVSDASGCTGTDQVDVTTNTNPSPSITGALSFCTGNSTTLDAGGGYTAYLWSTGSTNQTINVTTAGNYTVTVSDANGCTGTSQVTVTVSSNLSPNIAGTLAICSGAATTLDAGNGYAAYLWSTGATTQTINVSAGGAYAVTVSDASGCTGTDNVTVTENNNPVPDITGALAFCPGGSTTLNAGGGYSSYNWSPSGNSQTIVVSVAGTYAVTVTDSYGCTGTDQVDVVESSAITLTLTPTDIVCYGQSSGSIDLSVSGGAMPFSYLWSNATTTEDLTNVSAGTYSVTVTDAGGCTGTGSASLTQPGQIVIGMTGNQTICNGESATLTVSVAGGVQPYTYHWSHSGVNSGTVTVSPTSATTYSCYVEDANGCISNTVSATITVAPPIQLSVSSSDTYVCPGDPALIAVVPTAGIGPPYLITFNGDVSNAPFIVYPNQTTTYTITAEDQCGSMASQSITINVYSLPPISFTSDTVQGCEPLTVNFVENSPDMGQTYVWNFGDEDNNNLSYSKYPVHVYDDPGVYDVTLTVTSAEGCVISDIIPDMITVWPKPEAIFIADPEVVSVIKPLIFFTNYSLLNDTNYWAFGDGDSSNAVHPYHQYPIYPTGTYNVELIVATNKGCRDTAYSTIIVKDEFTFYAPTAFSPDFDGTNDYFVVKGNGIDNSNFKLYIYDRWGEIIFESDDLYDGWDGRVKGGALAKNGTYTWLCIYFDLYGTEHQEAGAVTVIR